MNNNKTWTREFNRNSKTFAHIFNQRLKAVAKELIIEALGPEYFEIWEEALAIVSGEVAEFMESEKCSSHISKKLSLFMDSHLSQLHQQLDDSDEAPKSITPFSKEMYRYIPKPTSTPETPPAINFPSNVSGKILLPIKTPIPAKEMSPDGLGACDRNGRCYWGRFKQGTWRWRYVKDPSEEMTHWLPASVTALPARIPMSH